MRLIRLPSIKILFVLTYVGRYTHVTSPGWLVRDRIHILAQVERVAASHALRESESLRKLLNYLTHHALDHPGEPVKEYQIATEVLGRQSDFDPQLNSMVRVQAGRLRTKLTEYYSDEGSDDPIFVDFPKGTYALHFRERKPAAGKSPSADEQGTKSSASASLYQPALRASGMPSQWGCSSLWLVALHCWVMYWHVNPRTSLPSSLKKCQKQS